jgi:hypothetical protein
VEGGGKGGGWCWEVGGVGWVCGVGSVRGRGGGVSGRIMGYKITN